MFIVGPAKSIVIVVVHRGELIFNILMSSRETTEGYPWLTIAELGKVACCDIYVLVLHS